MQNLSEQNLSGQKSSGGISRFQIFQSLDLIGLVIFAIFTWLPDSYYKMVGWPWIVVWQIGFFAISITVLCQLRKFDQPFVGLGYRLDWALGSLVCLLLLSSLFAAFREVALWNLLLAILYAVALYGIRNRLANKTLSLNFLWQGLVVVGLIASIIALSLWRPTLDMWVSDSFEGAIRNRFPLGHHNFSGGYFVLVLPLMVTYGFAHKGWRRWLGFLAVALCAAALYSSGSRGAWLGAIVSILVSFVIAFFKGPPSKRRSITLIGLITILLGGFLLLSNPRIRNAVKFRSDPDNTSQPIQVVLADSPTKDRWFMAKAGVNVVKAYPILGTGPGNLARLYNRFRPIETGTGLELAQQLHNTPLQLLAELGIVGFIAISCFTYYWICLWVRLIHVPLSKQYRWLHVGIGASSLAYSVASLTDYQLENIGIASTLLISMAILIGLADKYVSTSCSYSLSAISQQYRRLLSLVVLIVLGLCLHSWISTDIANALSHSALEKSNQSNIVDADFQWAKAASITPWDPTPSALAAEQLVRVLNRDQHSPADHEAITLQAIEYYKMALQASPNDSWFNNNLAVLNLDYHPQTAELFARKTVQLTPRNQNYTYYTLGLAYLSQFKEAEAISSFVLQAISDPMFLTMTLWEEEPFRQLKAIVIEQTLNYYARILDELTPENRFYNLLYERVVLMRWLYDSKMTESDLNRLRPIVQAVLKAEVAPEQALQILDAQLTQKPQDEASRLLKAWINPEEYIGEFLKISHLSDAEKQVVQDHIINSRSLREWLTSITQPKSAHERYALALAYRNVYANGVRAMLQPEGLESVLLIELLNLFPNLPRELPVLDRQMEMIRVEFLNLPHPTS